MIRGSAFQNLGTVIDELEAQEMTVLDVAAQRSSLVSGGDLSVELTVRLNNLSGVATNQNVKIGPCDAADEDGQVTTTFVVEIPVDGDESATTTLSDGQESAVGDDESAAARDAAESERPDVQTLTQRSEESDGADDVPYYKNYDLLAEVYEEYDTFAEMTEALGVDVTPATVREHMVNHGIHPTSDENEDDEDESDVDARDDAHSVTIEADGYGLPDGVSMESLVDAVRRSRTLYETQSALGLDRSTTRTILCDLNLLDLVTGRITNGGPTDIDEVVERIHSASTA
ncbi:MULTISPECIES: hypothetical protein [Salinibaculum]|uniref:hypothetical protein n=1 Tax=Salinibaculum TaxID=2732368 RepID=UPI0030D1D744